MAFSDNTVRSFIDLLASDAPAPGGGGAAALCGAVGCALSCMVGALTKDKKKYAGVRPEMIKLVEECRDIQEKLMELIDKDAEAFVPLSEAYSLPSDTCEEKRYKADELEKHSKNAAAVPLEIMRQCMRAIRISGVMKEKGSKLLVSDAGCSAVLLKSALEAASLNVFINTKGIKDEAFAASVNEEAEKMLRDSEKEADLIFSSVKASFSRQPS